MGGRRVRACVRAELRKSDTGRYTCKASSETGESTSSAALVVEAPTNHDIIFRRTPEPSTYPGPPSKPAVSDVRPTSVRLAWTQNPNNGASVVAAFLVEYFSPDSGEVWTRLNVAIVSVIESLIRGWLGSRGVSVPDSGAEGPGFRSQPRRCRVTVLGKLFAPIVPLFAKQRNWQQPSFCLWSITSNFKPLTASLVESNGSLPPGL